MAAATKQASFGPELFSFLADLRAQQRPGVVRGQQAAVRGAPARAGARVHRRLRAPAREDQPSLPRRRAAERRLALPDLPGHALLEGQVAVQDERRNPLPARAGQGRPRARLLPPHRPGRGLRRRRHLASGHRGGDAHPRGDRRGPATLEARHARRRLREAARARRRVAQARPAVGRRGARVRGRPEAEGLLRLGAPERGRRRRSRLRRRVRGICRAAAPLMQFLCDALDVPY